MRKNISFPISGSSALVPGNDKPGGITIETSFRFGCLSPFEFWDKKGGDWLVFGVWSSRFSVLHINENSRCSFFFVFRRKEAMDLDESEGLLSNPEVVDKYKSAARIANEVCSSFSPLQICVFLFV